MGKLCLYQTFCHIQVFVFFILFSLIDGQQVDLTSSIRTGEHYCSNEVLVFTCNGSGTAILWTVPSVIDSQGFVDSETPPLSRPFAGGNAIITLEQAMPTLVSTLQLRNVPNATVSCFTDVPNSIQTLNLNSSLTPSQIAAPIMDPKAGSIEITWQSETDGFDLAFYNVSLFVNDELNATVNATAPPTTIPINFSDGDEVYVSVFAVSDCGMEGSPGVSSRVIILIPPTPATTPSTTPSTTPCPTPGGVGECNIICIILAIICGVLAIALIIFVGLFIWKCCEKRNPSVHSFKSPGENTNSGLEMKT